MKLPSLNERKEDIGLMVKAYLKVHYPEMSISKEGISLLKGYHYTGNIRQLLNLVERCIVMADADVIHPQLVEDILYGQSYSWELVSRPKGVAPKEVVYQDVKDERDYIMKVLTLNLGNRKKNRKGPRNQHRHPMEKNEEI